MNILIVEDDQFLASKILHEFQKRAPVNVVKHISSYADFLRESNYRTYDIILLDIYLWEKNKEHNGLTILEHIRKNDTKIPIIIMSNMVQYSYLEKAFELWAHDYLIKPFRIRELQIRIQRWFHGYIFSEFFNYKKTLEYHDLQYIPASNEFLIQGEKIKLSKSNKYILSLFLINRESLLSQSFLIEKIWWYSENTENKNLRIKILRLKNSLKPYCLDSRIQTVHGEGYILEKD